MLWASNMGTLMAQTFTFLYAHVCCFVCRRSQRRKAERLVKKKIERERERDKSGSTRLLWTEKDGSPGLTMSSRLDGMSPWPGERGSTLGRKSTSVYPPGISDPEVKEVLQKCAKYNLEEGGNDDPLSEYVAEEIRHIDALDVIDEKSRSMSPKFCRKPKVHGHKNERMFPREDREGSAYENDSAYDSDQRSRRDKEAYMLSLDRKSMVSTLERQGSAVSTALLSPPTAQAPRASREPSPASSTRGLSANLPEEKDFEKEIKILDEGLPPIERVPALPVICFLCFYLCLGAVIFSEWEGWSFTEGFYFTFITLTTIGFGDFVPGDAVMSIESTDGQYKLICSVVYLLLGLAVLSMSFNLIQEDAVDFFVSQAKNCGIIDDDDDEGSEK